LVKTFTKLNKNSIPSDDMLTPSRFRDERLW